MSISIRRDGFRTGSVPSQGRASAPQNSAAGPARAGLKAAQARQRGWNGPPSRTIRQAAVGARKATAAKSRRGASSARKGKRLAGVDECGGTDIESPDDCESVVEAALDAGDADKERREHGQPQGEDKEDVMDPGAHLGTDRSHRPNAVSGARRRDALGRLRDILDDAMRSAQAGDAAGLRRAIVRLDDVMQSADAHRVTPAIVIEELCRQGRRVAKPSPTVGQLLALLPLKVLQFFAPRGAQQRAARESRSRLPFYRDANRTRSP